MRFAVSVRSVVAPAPTGSSTTGTPAAFAAFAASSIASIQCSDSVPMLSTSAPATAAISSTSSTRVRHHGQRAEGERRVRRLVHDDVVRDLVDERLALADRRARSALGSHVEDVHRPLAGADLDEPVADRLRRDVRGLPRGLLEGQALREQRGERGRVRAAGAVRCRDVVALDGDLDVPLAVEEMVDRIVAVPAGDDHRGRAELVDPLGELAPRARPGERLGLHQVRRDDRREREQPVDEHLDGVVLEQLRARARDHDRVDDQRHAVHGEKVGDRVDQLA